MRPTATLVFLIALVLSAPAAAATPAAPADDGAAECAAYAEFQDIYQACLDNLPQPGGVEAPDALPENGGEDTCGCSIRHRQRYESYLERKKAEEKEKQPATGQ